MALESSLWHGCLQVLDLWKAALACFLRQYCYSGRPTQVSLCGVETGVILSHSIGHLSQPSLLGSLNPPTFHSAAHLRLRPHLKLRPHLRLRPHRQLLISSRKILLALKSVPLTAQVESTSDSPCGHWLSSPSQPSSVTGMFTCRRVLGR